MIHGGGFCCLLDWLRSQDTHNDLQELEDEDFLFFHDFTLGVPNGNVAAYVVLAGAFLAWR